MHYTINEFCLDCDFELTLDGDVLPPIRPAWAIKVVRGSLSNLARTARLLRPQMAYDLGDSFLIDPYGPYAGVSMRIDLKARSMTLDCADMWLIMASSWVLNAGLGWATLRNGGLPLHGCGLVIDGHYVAIMGGGGVGKSTLAWYFIQHGALFGNDDLVPAYSEEIATYAQPSVSLYPTLLRDAVDQFGLDRTTLLPADYSKGKDEYFIPISANKRTVNRAPLAAIIWLEPQAIDVADPIRIQRMKDLVSAKLSERGNGWIRIRQNMHAVWLLAKWMNEPKLDTKCKRLADQVPVYELSYPRTKAAIPQLARTIKSLLSNITP
jgi:hypothetical protein